MPCGRCGREVYPLYATWPTKVARVMGKLRNLVFVCWDCLTPKEQLDVRLEEYERERLVEGKPTVTRDEIKWAEETLTQFRCPQGWDPHTCDGKSCPVKSVEVREVEVDGRTVRYTYAEDHYWDCIDYLEAESLLLSVLEGRVKVIETGVRPFGEGRWEAPL